MFDQKLFFTAIAFAILLSGCGTITTGTGLTGQTDEDESNPPLSRAEWQVALDLPATCDDTFGDFEETNGIGEYALNETESIVLVECFLTAYQINYQLYRYDHETEVATELTLPYFDAGELVQQNEFSGIVEPEFADNGHIYLFSKYAGHGGCGYAAEFAWDEAAQGYQLISQAEHDDCENPLMADEWPSVYPAE